MRKTFAIMTAGAIVSAALYGQSRDAGNQAFQLAVSPENHLFRYTTIGSQVVTGRPFSATEERHSSQVLGDGTHIETTETNRLFRDEQGRTRLERKDGNISIYDPVAGFSAELESSSRAAMKKMTASIRTVLAATAPRDEEARKRAKETAKAMMKDVTSQIIDASIADAMENAQKAEAGGTVEHLPPQMINGVLSQGTRTTETIPVGKIGNDRAISVVNERWYSNDLQILIRSSSSDPRFGDSIYQLSNIVQTSPDPSLFQIPGDYTIRK